MKKIVLILSSVLLVVLFAIAYLVFICHNVYVLDLNPRHQLQVNRASFTAVKDVVKNSPEFRKNLLIIFPAETKTTNRFSATSLDVPGGSQVLYYSDWQTAGPFDILYIYIVDDTFNFALNSGQPKSHPLINLSLYLSVELSRKYDFSKEDMTRIRAPLAGGPGGSFITLSKP